MSADFSPLDTTQRQKVLGIIQNLSDAGLSEADIQRYFQNASSLGQQNLQQGFNAAALSLGQQFTPQFQAAQARLGANPLLADSGYANQLNSQLQSDLYSRLAGNYGQQASDMANRNLGFLQDLYGRRIAGRQALIGAGYQTMTGLPRRKRWQDQALGALGQIGGAAAGAAIGGPPGAAIGSSAGSAAGGGGYYQQDGSGGYGLPYQG